MPGKTSTRERETLLASAETSLVRNAGSPSLTLKKESRPEPSVWTRDRPSLSSSAASKASSERPWLAVSNSSEVYSKVRRFASLGISTSDTSDVTKEDPSSSLGEQEAAVTLPSEFCVPPRCAKRQLSLRGPPLRTLITLRTSSGVTRESQSTSTKGGGRLPLLPTIGNSPVLGLLKRGAFSSLMITNASKGETLPAVSPSALIGLSTLVQSEPIKRRRPSSRSILNSRSRNRVRAAFERNVVTSALKSKNVRRLVRTHSAA